MTEDPQCSDQKGRLLAVSTGGRVIGVRPVASPSTGDLLAGHLKRIRTLSGETVYAWRKCVPEELRPYWCCSWDTTYRTDDIYFYLQGGRLRSAASTRTATVFRGFSAERGLQVETLYWIPGAVVFFRASGELDGEHGDSGSAYLMVEDRKSEHLPSSDEGATKSGKLAYWRNFESTKNDESLASEFCGSVGVSQRRAAKQKQFEQP